MHLSILLKPGDLRVISAVASNVASGLILAPLTTRNAIVLTASTFGYDVYVAFHNR